MKNDCLQEDGDLIKIGVLALQGDYLEHQRILQILGISSTYIKTPDELTQIDGLILPGGESTTINKLLNYYNIKNPLKKLVQQGMPIWGTCAGMIIIANKIVQSTPKPLSLMNITVDRNAYGNQTESFEQLIKPDDLYRFYSLLIPRVPAIGLINFKIFVGIDIKFHT